MIRNKASILLLASIITLTGVGVANAQDNHSGLLADNTKINKEELLRNPTETSKQIIDDYFTSIMISGDNNGAALSNYSIVEINDSDLEDIKVTLNLSYVDVPPLPDVTYHIKRDGQFYQVEQQFCSYDLSPNSPHYGTVSCSAGSNNSVSW